MKNMIFVTLLATVAFAGCSSTSSPVESSEVSLPPQGTDLFQEAHRCQGKVRYQIEQLGDQVRSRLSCEWEVRPDQWGEW